MKFLKKYWWLLALGGGVVWYMTKKTAQEQLVLSHNSIVSVEPYQNSSGSYTAELKYKDAQGQIHAIEADGPTMDAATAAVNAKFQQLLTA